MEFNSGFKGLKSRWEGGARLVEKCVTISNFVCLVTDKDPAPHWPTMLMMM